MKKYIKFVSLIIIILSILFGFQALANDDQEVTKTEDVKKEVKVTREERVKKLNDLVVAIKAKREEFKTEIEKTREEARLKIGEMRTKFKDDLLKIKDETKRTSSEKIVNTIDFLNAKFTASLSDKVDQIENVLTSIESRITKAEAKGLDVSTIKPQVEKAKKAISDARESIQAQTKKVYEVSITDESTLRAEMKKLRDTFIKDVKAVREQVKLAHVAVRDTATTLAKIPKIDEVEDVVEVENDNDDNSNSN